MFTIEQIKAAHQKVKSGADFPEYIRDLIRLGVARYETFVSDNRTEYFSRAGKTAESPAHPGSLSVSTSPDKERFTARLKLHQQGGTDYSTFRRDCAENGISKWIVDLAAKNCIYYDLSGKEVLTETIPS